MIKVLNLSTNIHGGAGTAGLRIHRALIESDAFESVLFTKSGMPSDADNIYRIASKTKNILHKVIAKISQAIFFKSDFLVYSAVNTDEKYQIISLLEYIKFKPDVIILHWVANFVGSSELRALKRKYPKAKFYWYLMDMAPITGGCHYAFDCKGYEDACTECPAARLNYSKRLVQQNFADKKQLFSDLEMGCIAPNLYVCNQAAKSALPINDLRINYIPIDSKLFRKPEVVRDEITILFGSDLRNYRKGGDLFYKTLLELDELLLDYKNRPLVRAIVPNLVDIKNEKFKIVQLASFEYAKTDEGLRDLYNRSNIFVCCSREDSGPMMISEALMSGLTIVSFEVGIVSELIEDGINGYVIKDYSVTEMAKQLLQIILNRENYDTGTQARLKAETLLASECFVEQLMKIYD